MSDLWGREVGCHPIEIVPIYMRSVPLWKVLHNRKSTPIVSPEDVPPLEVFPYGKPSTGEQINKDCIKR